MLQQKVNHCHYDRPSMFSTLPDYHLSWVLQVDAFLICVVATTASDTVVVRAGIVTVIVIIDAVTMAIHCIRL